MHSDVTAFVDVKNVKVVFFDELSILKLKYSILF